MVPVGVVHEEGASVGHALLALVADERNAALLYLLRLS